MKTPFRVGAILFHEGKLVTTRMQKHVKTYHVLPGGGVEEHETIYEALKRELREELNIEITKFRLVYMRELTITGYGRGLELYFYIESYNGVPTKGHDPEKKESVLEDIDFLDLDELSKYTFYPVQLIGILKEDRVNNFPEIKHLGLHTYP